MGLLHKYADLRISIPSNIAEGCGRAGNADILLVFFKSPKDQLVSWNINYC